MVAQPIRTIKIFYCYAQEDDALREELARHLSPLRRLRYITGWYKHDIQAGADWDKESRTHLEAANIILLLLSADFFASDYHYAVEMERAIRKHKAGTAHVIPILLRPVGWKETPIGELSALPVNEKPVTQWTNRDEAWLNIVEGIRGVISKLLSKQELSGEEIDILYPEHGPLSGQTIGEKYLLGELIGEGGFSQVYKAQHLQLQRQQAVKVLLERHFRKREFRDRFLREARMIASLDHPSIIHLDDFWVEASQAYLVMPYMSGGTFQYVLEKERGFLQRDQIVFYLEQICAALDYAHEQGVVHLDLKPLNILVHKGDKLLLSDFGLAHLMKDGAVAGGSSLRIGTPHYMAPEHIKGFPEKRSDLFSLGVILYQMLVGRLPFDGLPYETILLKNMTEWPPAPRVLRPELPQSVEDMLGRALAKQPEQRYQTANEFLVVFKKALAISTKPPIMSSHYDQGGPRIIDLAPVRYRVRGHRKRQLRLDVAQHTDVGRKRLHNEDNMAYVLPKDPQVMMRKGALFIVADGMEEYLAGEVASEIVVDTVSNVYYQDDSDDSPVSLVHAINRANEFIYLRAAENMRHGGMGTACVAAVLRGSMAYITNVGDSRAYLVRNGQIKQVSQDHLGCLGRQIDVYVDVFAEQLEEGDSLVLCSHGLSGLVGDEEIRAIVDQYPPQESVYQLIERANENGGPDNITAIVIRVQEVD